MTGPVDPRLAAIVSIEAEVAQQAKVEWYRMQTSSLQASFEQGFLPVAQPALTAGQAAAARLAADQVSSITGQPSTVIPSGFAGYASDGRKLSSMMAQALVRTYVDLDNGLDTGQALDRGWDSIDRMLATQINDSARRAESVQMVEHKVSYYVRRVEPGACSRCIILAGRKYKINAGFERHPQCRCYHVPYVTTYLDAVDYLGQPVGKGQMVGNAQVGTPFSEVIESPEELFAAMTTEQQDRAFTKAGADAIRAGADMYRVVNARYSTKDARMTTMTDRNGKQWAVTTVGARPGRYRLLPETIYARAAGDPKKIHDLLVKNGYIRR